LKFKKYSFAYMYNLILRDKQLVWLVIGAILITSCRSMDIPSLEAVPVFSERPKNIVLLIGDGMGLSQISTLVYSQKEPSSFEQFTSVGFHKSHSWSDLITDSAAGATAFACGVKTFNNAIGMNKDTQRVLSILEEAEQAGMSTGLVATASIVHATPAAFIAHQPMRTMYEAIAADFLNTEIDFFLGGGQDYFESRVTDKRNLVEELRKNNYVVLQDYNGFIPKKFNPEKNFAFFTAGNHPAAATGGRNYLPAAATLALNFLELHDTKGFFLLIEGSQIDWAGHANDGYMLKKEMLDFDRTVSRVLDYAKRKGDTLVIVTADHETGGMALQPGSRMGNIKAAFTTNGHSASLVPVFAFGPGADLFTGIYENTAIHQKMREALGLDEQ
jgi:alkaline phosphatase